MVFAGDEVEGLSYERHARCPEVCASAMSLVMMILQLPKTNVQLARRVGGEVIVQVRRR